MRCKNCNHELEEKSVYCGNCGIKIEEDESLGQQPFSNDVDKDDTVSADNTNISDHPYGGDNVITIDDTTVAVSRNKKLGGGAIAIIVIAIIAVVAVVGVLIGLVEKESADDDFPYNDIFVQSGFDDEDDDDRNVFATTEEYEETEAITIETCTQTEPVDETEPIVETTVTTTATTTTTTVPATTAPSGNEIDIDAEYLYPSDQKIVIADGGLRIRSEPVLDDANILGLLSNGSIITVYKVENNWAYVNAAGKYGWCSCDYLFTPYEYNGVAMYTATIYCPTFEGAELFSDGYSEADLLRTTVLNGNRVTVYAIDEDMAFVKYSNLYGWCYVDYLTID